MALALCLPIHFLWFFIVWIAAIAVDAHLPFSLIVLVTTTVWIATMIPATVAGLGIRELGFVYLLGQNEITDEQSALIAFFQSLIIIIFGIIGLPLLWESIKRKNNESS